MRILHIIGGLEPRDGGPPVIAASIAAAQQALGHSPVIASRLPRPEAAAQLLAGIPGAAQVPVVPLPAPEGLEKALGLCFRAPVFAAVEQTDVVHMHGIWETELRVAAAAARKFGKPYFILVNGMLDPWALSQRRLKKKIALALAYRKMFDGAAALHVGNQDEARLLAPLAIKAPPVIIPNGVFVEQIDPLPEPGTFRRLHPELGDRPFVLFLSRLHFKKGLDILAAAFAQVAAAVPACDLAVVGPDEGQKEAFEQQVQSLGISSRVHVLGPAYNRDKYAAMVDAAVFCLPSRQEGFSVAITEALACGKPVVITEACHFPEVAQSRAGLVTPVDPQAVGDALIQLLRDDSLRSEMGANARQLVLSRYTWPVIARQTIQMYERALGTNPVKA